MNTSGPGYCCGRRHQHLCGPLYQRHCYHWHRIPPVDRHRHRGSNCGTIRVVGRNIGSCCDGGGGDDVNSNPFRGRRHLDRHRCPCPLCRPDRRCLRDGDGDQPPSDAVDCDSPILCCSNYSILLLLRRFLSAAKMLLVLMRLIPPGRRRRGDGRGITPILFG